jgi:4-aminobutyrate aminotransferase
MIGIELVGPDGAPDPAKAVEVLEGTRDRGLLVGKGGLYGNVIRLAPPMTLTEDEVEEALGILEDVL